MSTAGGRIGLPDGLSYRLLVLQNCTSPSAETSKMIGDALSLPVSPVPSRAMTVEAVRKIRDLVRDGATVVGPKPLKASGLKDYPRCDDEVRSIADEFGATATAEPTEHASARAASFGAGPGRDSGGRRGSAGFAPWSAEGRPCLRFYPPHGGGDGHLFRLQSKRPPALRGVRLSHRRQTTGDLGPCPGEFATPPLSAGTAAAPSFPGVRADAIAIRRLPKPIEAGARERRPQFPPARHRPGNRGRLEGRVRSALGRPGGGRIPRAGELDAASRRRHQILFRKSDLSQDVRLEPRGAPAPETPVLDLGAVKEVAEVRLNGKSLGVLWTAPWRIEITGAVNPRATFWTSISSICGPTGSSAISICPRTSGSP